MASDQFHTIFNLILGQMRKMRSRAGVLLFLVLSSCAGPVGLDEPASRDASAEHAFGCLLSTPEQLRKIPKALTPFCGADLPASVDLSADLPPPGNQGRQNSCVAWSVAYALKSYEEKLEEKLPLITPEGAIDPHRVFSPAFIYNQVNNGRDGGCLFSDALDVLKAQGAATLADAPYNEADYTLQPSPEARASAARYHIDSWRQINVADEKELKAQLNAGYPVLFAARVDEGFTKAGKGYVWKAPDGKQLGAHAMVLVGYDDRRNAFKLINSWGAGWCDDGFGWIDYAYFRNVAAEGYVVKNALHTQETVVPSPETPPIPEVEFALTNVTHNAVIPGSPEQGFFMRLDGTLAIPPGTGKSDQVVIWFFFDAGEGQKGQPVQSLQAAYSTSGGDAACGTGVYSIPPEGLRTTWTAWIPYSALHLWTGSFNQTPAGPVYEPALNSLVAEPVLFVDNFGIASGGLVPFAVNR